MINISLWLILSYVWFKGIISSGYWGWGITDEWKDMGQAKCVDVKIEATEFHYLQ